MSRTKNYVVHVVPPKSRAAVCGRPDPRGNLISAETEAGADRMVATAPTLQSYKGTSWEVCPGCRDQAEVETVS